MPATANPSLMSPEASSSGPAISLGGEAIRRANARARKSGLLIDAARQFSSIQRPTRKDLVVFKELFYQLLDGTDKSERRLLAATLARNPYTPRTVLYCLALDEPDIAAPVLMFCEALNEFDIVQLVKRLPQLSLEIMCRRSALTPTSVRALIKHGSEACRSLLARNPAFFEDAAIQAIIAGLEKPLEEPAPLQPVRMVSRPTQVQLPNQAKAGLTASKSDELLAMASRSGRLGRMQGPATNELNAIDPKRPIEPQLVAMVRAGDHHALAQRLADWCGIKPIASLAILEKGGASERIALFKGLGLSNLGTMQCLLRLDPTLGKNFQAYNEAKRLLQELDDNQCKAIVKTLGADFEAMRKPAMEPSHAILEIGQLATQRRRELSQGPAQRPVTAPPQLPQRNTTRLSIL